MWPPTTSKSQSLNLLFSVVNKQLSISSETFKISEIVKLRICRTISLKHIIPKASLKLFSFNHFLNSFTRKRRDGFNQRQRAGREVEDHRNVDESSPGKVQRVISYIFKT
jgi:hypothetical protein